MPQSQSTCSLPVNPDRRYTTQIQTKPLLNGANEEFASAAGRVWVEGGGRSKGEGGSARSLPFESTLHALHLLSFKNTGEQPFSILQLQHSLLDVDDVSASWSPPPPPRPRVFFEKKTNVAQSEWEPTSTCPSSTPRSSRTFSSSSLESDAGSTDNSLSSTELPDLLDRTRPDDWVTRPSRVTSSTESEFDEETGRSLSPRVLLTVNPSDKVSTT